MNWLWTLRAKLRTHNLLLGDLALVVSSSSDFELLAGRYLLVVGLWAGQPRFWIGQHRQ